MEVNLSPGTQTHNSLPIFVGLRHESFFLIGAWSLLRGHLAVHTFRLSGNIPIRQEVDTLGMLTTSQFTPVLTSTALRAKRAFDKHFFGIVARVHPPWWCGVLLGSYTITFGACFFFSSFTLPYDLFTNACVGSIFAFFLALQGMLGTISTLLIWRLLKILKIPSPVNVLLAVITSIFVAVVFHPIASSQIRQTGWEFFYLGVFPTLLGSIAAGLLILSRTSGISETKLIKTDNDGVTPISYTES